MVRVRSFKKKRRKKRKKKEKGVREFVRWKEFREGFFNETKIARRFSTDRYVGLSLTLKFFQFVVHSFVSCYASTICQLDSRLFIRLPGIIACRLSITAASIIGLVFFSVYFRGLGVSVAWKIVVDTTPDLLDASVSIFSTSRTWAKCLIVGKLFWSLFWITYWLFFFFSEDSRNRLYVYFILFYYYIQCLQFKKVFLSDRTKRRE